MTINLKKYSKATGLPIKFLKKNGLDEDEYKGKTSIKIPYLDRDGDEITTRYRNALKGEGRFKWKKGTKVSLYGLWLLDKAEEKEFVFIVEGESDCQTLWYNKIPAIGVPGATNWNEKRDAHHLKNIPKIYFIMEPDEGGRTLLKKLKQSSFKKRIKVIKLKGYKDVNEMYIANPEGFKKAFRKAKKGAVPMAETFLYAYDDINRGSRNNQLTSIAGKLRSEGYKKKKLRKVLMLINKEKCNPSLQDSEVKGIVDSIIKYEAGNSGSQRKLTFETFMDEHMSNLYTFHTAINEAYAIIDIADHQEILAIRSKEFDNLLQKQYYDEYKKNISQTELKRITDVLTAKAQFDSEMKKVHIRVAGSEWEVYLDLANEKREVIKITPDGWNIMSDSPYYFIRPTGMKALPYPRDPKEKGFMLKRFLNTSKLLIPAWLLGTMNPSGPYPVLVLQGGPGSGKSTTARMVKQLIDPSEGLLRTYPGSYRDLMVSAGNSWMLAFDNLSGIPRWLSDGFCQLSTGGGLSVRKNYTNTQEQIFDAVRPVIINGIDDLAVRSDLADRAIVIDLPTISDKERMAEKEFWSKFDKAKPYILGSLIQGVSTALKNLKSTDLKSKPRMADFTQWVVAGEPAMPWRKGLFLEKYKENNEAKNMLCLYYDDLAISIVDFIREKKRWKGTSEDLLSALKKALIDQNKELKRIPNGPAALAKELRRTAHILNETGVEVDFDRTSTKRIIKMKLKRTSV